MSTAPTFVDWLAISTLKARYCRLLDTKDWAGFAELFTADFILDATASGGPRIEGAAAAIASVRTSIEAAKTVHHIHSPEMEVDGETVLAVWAMQDRLIWPNGRALSGAGHYHERYVRIDGAWKIAESMLTRLTLEMTPPAVQTDA